MSYSIVDKKLYSWADGHGLQIHTNFKDFEVRSIDIVSPEGKRFQLWIDEPDKKGNTVVHIWDMKKKSKDFCSTHSSLRDKLEAAYQQAQNWF